MKIQSRMSVLAIALLAASVIELGGTRRQLLRGNLGTVVARTLRPDEAADPSPVSTCTLDSRLFQNLARAADTALPVHTLIMRYETLPAPTLAEFVEQTGAEPTLPAVQQQVAAGATWQFEVDGDRALLRIWPDHHLDVQTGEVVSFLEYWFPRGKLPEAPALSAAVTQLRESFQGHLVGGANVTVSQPVPGPTEFRFWSGPLDLSRVNEDDSVARECTSWSNQTVSVYRNGRFEAIPVTELNVGNGILLAFGNGLFMTKSIKSGIIEVRVYEMPGLEFVPLRDGPDGGT